MYYYLLLSIICFVPLFCAFKPLEDFDLGWHLAGGLWMLDHWQVPSVDPFGALGAEWINYSWLAQLFFAGTYKLGGFFSVYLLQGVLVCILVCAYYLCSVKLSTSDNELYKGFVAAISTALMILFTAPYWALRPQLISLILFLITITLLESGTKHIVYFFILVILWANIHVYWVFLPLIFLIYFLCDSLFCGFLRADFIKHLLISTLLFFSGAVSPYGIYNLKPIFQYAFSHGTANSFITEFVHLSTEQGYVFYLFIAVTLIFIYYIKTCFKYSRALTISTFIFVFFSIWQIKYIGMFGVCAGFLLPACFRSFGIQGNYESRKQIKASYFVIVLLAIIIVYSVGFVYIFIKNPLHSRVESLFSIVHNINESYISNNKSCAELVVLNHFNDGGWLSLAFYLSTLNKKLKTAIDGRTLVIGEKRLKEFAMLDSLSKGWQDVLLEWNTALAILPNNFRLVQEFFGQKETAPAKNLSFTEISKNAYYSAFIRNDCK